MALISEGGSSGPRSHIPNHSALPFLRKSKRFRRERRQREADRNDSFFQLCIKHYSLNKFLSML